MQILLSIFLFVIIICVKNYDSKKCARDQPFLASDLKCSKFSEICFKSDEECQRLLSACDQCPPNNLTISYLNKLIKTAHESSISTGSIHEKLQKTLEEKFEFFKVNMSNCQKNIDKNFEELLLICIIILVVLFVVIIIMLVENRFKLFTKFCGLYVKNTAKFCGSCVKNTEWTNNYNLLQSRKQLMKKNLLSKEGVYGISNSLQTQINEIKAAVIKSNSFMESFEHLQKQINEIKAALIKSNSFMESFEDRSRKIQFKIIGENKPIELYVHGYDTVVYIKDLICSEWAKSKEFYYKIMKLKCDEKYVDNNAFLLLEIPLGRDVLQCETDNNLVEKKFVVLQIKGIQERNAFLQVDKNDKINKLKDIIKNLIKRSNFEIFSKNGENLIKHSNFEIFSKNGETFTKLEDNKTIESYNLQDKDFIQIVFKEQINLNIQTIFESRATLPVECFNTDKVMSIYDKIKTPLHPHDLVLIMDSQYLDEINFIFQYSVSSDSPIKYCRFNEADKLNKIRDLDDKGDIYLAEDLIKNKQIIVKRYFIPAVNNFKRNPVLIKEMSTFDILKSKKKFVQIYEPFVDKEYLYISMEYMEKGSLKDILESRNNTGSYVSENEIKNWSMQILNAIDALHRNNIIHGNLKTSNILFNEKDKLKLSNFGLSKYLYDQKFSEALKGFMPTDQVFRHVAPEMKGEYYGNKIDIWSFGIVLLEINNGKSIFPELNDTDAVIKLGNATRNEDIKYSFRKDTSQNLKYFIKHCLEIDPLKRPTVKILKEEPFLDW